MPCTSCLRDRPAVSRGLCNACYQRWRKTGSTDYQRWGKRSVCGVQDCNDEVVARDLCQKHYARLKRHGHTEDTRPDDWGSKEGHPLYKSWQHHRRYGMDASWKADFLQFVMDVGGRPTPKHKLFSADPNLPIGPGNFVWRKSITEIEPGEDPKKYARRVERIFRALRREQSAGYDLKKKYGISAERYAEMLAEQDGKCAICRGQEHRKIRGKVLSLAVDHCHSSGKVGRLLCADCNRGLGLFRDDPGLLERAAAYLRGSR